MKEYLISHGLPALTLIVGFVLGRLSKRAGFCKKAATRANNQQKNDVKKVERPFEKRKPHPAPADGSIEIYVGNLSYDVTDELLNKEFAAYGKVNSARIVFNRMNGKSKGFGFVQMPVRAEAEAAVKALNDKEILGRKIKCNEAKNLI